MSDTHWLGAAALPRPVRSVRTSRYLPMRDGVRIAIDLHLPVADGPARRLPAILRQTRYFRSLAPRAPFGFLSLDRAFDLYARTRAHFLAAGYAWIDADVRGSGASFGAQPYPWNPDEVRDGAEIVDWITSEPWSNGLCGSLGMSYDGTASELLLANRHPAVRAVAPMFALFDVFPDVAFPGGLHLSWFTERWARYNATLDANAFYRALAPTLWLMARSAHASTAPRGADRLLARLGAMDPDRFHRLASGLLGRLFDGVRPVEKQSALLLDAVAAHAGNFSVHEGALHITHRDDIGLSPSTPDVTVDRFSPHAHAAAAKASGAAVYSYSGWRDGAYPHSAIKRHQSLATDGGRLTLGPWVHSGKLRIRPFDVAVPTSFDHDAELLSFFDRHLAGRDRFTDGKPVHYYTLVEERWKSADRWPPPGAVQKSLFLDENRTLSFAPPSREGHDVHDIDPTAGTGERSRWRSLISLVPGDYPDRALRDQRLLCYDSPPLDRPLEVTGHPILTIYADYSTPDGRLFAYLEDVAPDGRVCYVTEGQLRALHRKTTPSQSPSSPVPQRTFLRADAMPHAPGELLELSFDLLPVSYLFHPSHRLRLALSGSDADHFTPPPPSTLRVHRSPQHRSRLDLPTF